MNLSASHWREDGSCLHQVATSKEEDLFVKLHDALQAYLQEFITDEEKLDAVYSEVVDLVIERTDEEGRNDDRETEG